MPYKERPIIFSGPMVRAILESRKTQTRRVAKPLKGHPSYYFLLKNCPYGKKGDRLYVKESFLNIDGVITYRADNPEMIARWQPAIYMPRWASRATLEVVSRRLEHLQDISEQDALAEGVESFLITENPSPLTQTLIYRDYTGDSDGCLTAKASYMTLWHHLYGDEPVKGWKANPRVWVVEFKRVRGAE